MSDTANIAELTLGDGNPISVNLGNVDYFRATDEGTQIVFSGGTEVVVSEGYDLVAELLNPERQAGC